MQPCNGIVAQVPLKKPYKIWVKLPNANPQHGTAKHKPCSYHLFGINEVHGDVMARTCDIISSW